MAGQPRMAVILHIVVPFVGGFIGGMATRQWEKRRRRG